MLFGDTPIFLTDKTKTTAIHQVLGKRSFLDVSKSLVSSGIFSHQSVVLSSRRGPKRATVAPDNIPGVIDFPADTIAEPKRRSMSKKKRVSTGTRIDDDDFVK